MRAVSSCGGEGSLVECEVVGDVMAVFGGEWICGGGLPDADGASCEGGGKRSPIVEGAMDGGRGNVVGCAQQWFGGSGSGEGSHLRGLL